MVLLYTVTCNVSRKISAKGSFVNSKNNPQYTEKSILCLQTLSMKQVLSNISTS